eukprot:s826_g10.t2
MTRTGPRAALPRDWKRTLWPKKTTAMMSTPGCRWRSCLLNSARGVLPWKRTCSRTCGKVPWKPNGWNNNSRSGRCLQICSSRYRLHTSLYQSSTWASPRQERAQTDVGRLARLQVDRLLGQLAQMSELRDVTLPRLPPKVTIRSTWAGRFDETFLQERQGLLTTFFEELCTVLNGKYSAIGNVLDLCEPLGEPWAESEQRRSDFETFVTSPRYCLHFAFQFCSFQAAIRREEDRQIIASQDAEYEESLRQDELRRIAQAEKAEKERLVAEEEARQQKAAEEEAAALVEERRLRRETFDMQHPLPEVRRLEVRSLFYVEKKPAPIESRRLSASGRDGAGRSPKQIAPQLLFRVSALSKATVRFRAASGATIQRAFAEDTQVCALFEFAAVADWDGPALGRSFDLRSWTKQPHEKYEISLPAAIRGKDVFPGDEPAGEGIADAQGSWTVSFHDASRCGARRLTPARWDWPPEAATGEVPLEPAPCSLEEVTSFLSRMAAEAREALQEERDKLLSHDGRQAVVEIEQNDPGVQRSAEAPALDDSGHAGSARREIMPSPPSPAGSPAESSPAMPDAAEALQCIEEERMACLEELERQHEAFVEDMQQEAEDIRREEVSLSCLLTVSIVYFTCISLRMFSLRSSSSDKLASFCDGECMVHIADSVSVDAPGVRVQEEVRMHREMRLSLSCTTVFLLIYVACGGMPTEKQKAMGGKERAEEQLESDHGDKWEDVRDILVGLRASSPEAIMRARFTALRFQDPQFLAATEKDDNQSIRDRAKQWSLLLGLEEMGMFDKMMNLNSDAFNLREPAGFEVLSADGEWVEFKIVCSSKTLTEKSRFEARMRAKKHQEESRERAMKRREEIQEKQKQARERGRTEAQVGDFVKHCEAQKSIAMLSWQKAFSELSDQMTAEDKKQEVLLGAQGQMALQKLFRPPTLHTMGYVRAGHLPKEIRQLLLSHLNKHRSRSFVEAFNPLLGNQRKAKALPLLPEWTKKGGFIDNLLRPILEKASGRTMELVRVGASLRIYEEGASLMQHVDSPETPITVAMPLEANGAGSSWHLQIGDPQGRKQRPVPLQPGQLLIYEGARLAHGRAGQLPHGDLTMAFAYYRPKENYEAKRIQRTLDQLLASHNAAQRGPSKPPPPKPQKKTKEFRKMDEL